MPRKPATSRASFAPKPRGRVATAEVDYSADEGALLRAVEAWKKRTKRQFPTVTDIFAMVRELGYRKSTEGGG